LRCEQIFHRACGIVKFQCCRDNGNHRRSARRNSCPSLSTAGDEHLSPKNIQPRFGMGRALPRTKRVDPVVHRDNGSDRCLDSGWRYIAFPRPSLRVYQPRRPRGSVSLRVVARYIAEQCWRVWERGSFSGRRLSSLTGASSKTTHLEGETFRRCEARRNGSGKGLPRVTSSAQTTWIKGPRRVGELAYEMRHQTGPGRTMGKCRSKNSR